MIPFEKIKTIFFDYDGTLHNSIKIYDPAFRKACAYLAEQGLADEKQWEDKEISYWLGFNPDEMWRRFMPELDDETRANCSRIIGEEMRASIEAGKAELYQGTLEVLEFLEAKGIDLVFISNCKSYYRDCHNKLFQLDKYFEKLVCSEDHDFIPKHEILKKIKDGYPQDMLIVGDRKQDIDAGRKNNIHTIGCSYGFSLQGELDDADMIMNDILSLKELFK